MSSQQNLSYQAGQAKGQTEEKGNQLMDKASSAAETVKESMANAGQQIKEQAQNAAESVKNATGMNQNRK